MAFPTRFSVPISHEWQELLGPAFMELLLKAALWALLMGFIGFIGAIVLVVQLRKRKLLRREHRVWNVFSKLSYLLVLVVCLLVSVIGGALYGAQQQLNNEIETVIHPALIAQMPAIRQELSAELGKLPNTSLLTVRDVITPIMQDFLYQPKSDSYFERHKARLINGLVMRVGAMALNQAIHHALSLLPEMEGATGQSQQNELTQFTSAMILKAISGTGQKMDFSPLDKSLPRVFADAIHNEVNGIFKGIYTGLLIKFLLISLLISLEILVYFKYYLPKKQKVVAVNNKQSELNACL